MLRAEAEKRAAERHHETPIAHWVSFVATKGYAFTADEAKEHAKARAKAASRELTDAELVGVAGGVSLGELDAQKMIESDIADANASATASVTASVANTSID